MNNEKPPIGVCPYWIVIPRRIVELADSISRNAGVSQFCNSRYIKEWATEILLHCETLDKLRSLDGGKE